MNIQQEFSCNYPQLVYVEHRYLDTTQIGVSYVYMWGGAVCGGVRVFNIKNGNVQWKAPVATYKTWTDVNQRTR